MLCEGHVEKIKNNLMEYNAYVVDPSSSWLHHQNIVCDQEDTSTV